MGDKKLVDLKLDRYDHVWDLDTVVASQGNISGYIWPVIEYGNLSTTERKADVRQLRPGVFRKTIIEQIIADAGFTASGSYQVYDKYDRSVVAFANDSFVHSKAFTDKANVLSASARSTVRQELLSDFRTFLIVFQDRAATDPGNHWNGTEYTSTEVARFHVKLKYNMDLRDVYKGGSNPQIYMDIQLKRAGSNNWETLARNITAGVGDFTSFIYYDQVIEIDVDLNPGDKLRVWASNDPAIHRILGILLPGASIDITYTATDVVYGQQVQLAATLPDITQKDFFKDFLQNFGLIAIPDSFSKKLLLINMEDVYANKPIAQDITDKLIDATETVTYALTGYGVNNLLTYKNDDAVPATLGNGTMVLDNLTLEDNVTLFTSVFSASLKVPRLNGLNVTQIRKIDDPLKSLEFKTKTSPRILLDVKQSTPFNFFDGSRSKDVNMISLPNFDGLEYQNLLNDNYPEIQRMLNRPYVVVKSLVLKETDIADVDWRIPVYDKLSASYYYKNQITYIQGDESTISLIRLP